MTSETTIELGALSQDLKRVAIFIARGSTDNAKRFLQEALKNSRGVNPDTIPSYINKQIRRVKDLPKISDQMALAEEALTIGCILQNAVVAAKR